MATLTDLPVTHVAYSHHHLDHTSDAPSFVRAAAERGANLEIIATDATAELLEERRLDVPRPTRVVARDGVWEFEDVAIATTTPASGHTRDNAIFVLRGEDVAHCVDLVHPGWVEFDCFGLAESLAGYDDALRRLLELDRWQTLTAGHADVGSRGDVRQTLEYLNDVRAAAWEAFVSVDFGAGISPDAMPWAWLHAHRDAVVERVLDRLRGRWGPVPGFEESAASHAATVYWEFSLAWAGPGPGA